MSCALAPSLIRKGHVFAAIIGAQRVAMKQGSNVTYLHSDHPFAPLRAGSSTPLRTSLGSTSATSGASAGTQVYYPYGGVRSGMLPTDYGFTGQKLDASVGLMYYGSRYYDAALGRFISADTISPNPFNLQSLNRYSYVLNNPVRYVDPSGHCPTAEEGGCERDEHENVIFREDQEEYGVERPDAVDSCRTANCWGVDPSHNLPANLVPTSNAMPQAFPPPTHGPPSTPIATPQGTPSLPDGTLNATPQASSLPTHGTPNATPLAGFLPTYDDPTSHAHNFVVPARAFGQLLPSIESGGNNWIGPDLRVGGYGSAGDK